MENLHAQITDYLLRQSWQIAVLAVAVAAVSVALRNKSAHVRYLLWLIVLAKCLVPPLLELPLAVLPAKEVVEPVATASVDMPPVEAEAVEVVPFEPATAPSVPVVVEPTARPRIWERLGEVTVWQWVALAWVAGIGTFVVVATLKALRVNRWLRRERKALPEGLEAAVEDSFGELGVKSVPKVWLVDGIGQPFVWGLLRGGIYLPGNFTRLDSDESRRNVLGHELSHILRFDAAVNLLQIIAQAIFWFHPFVWWANKRIRAEREKCCDEMAIARLGARAKDYSRAIVNTLVAEHEAAVPIPSLAVAGPVKNIEDRIKTIMRPGKRFYKRPTLIAAATVLLLALIAVPTTLALTARKGKVPEKMNVQTILEKVRQAQRPAEVMQVEWEFEAGKIPEEVHIAWGRWPVPHEHPEEYKAIFDSSRSRVEYHTEGYKSREAKGPHISVLETIVFDDKKQRTLRSLEYDGKRQEQFGREREGYNKNMRTITGYVNAWPVNFNNKKELEGYEFAVLDGHRPGIYILELTRDGKLSHRLTVDANRSFNIVKGEDFDPEGRKAYERNVTLKKHSKGIWYPSEVKTITYWVDFRKATRPVENTTRIIKVRFNPEVSADTFELAFPEGTKVWDKTRGIHLIIGKSGLPEKIDVESVLTRVQQAQRPAANMRIEWVSEHSAGRKWALPRNPEEQASLTKYKCSAVLSGVRTRYEQRQETYRPKDIDEPSLIEDSTYVFDGAKGAHIEKLTKGFEGGGSRGYLGLHDTGAVVLRQELFGGDDPPIHSQEGLREWELTVSESDVPGVLILDARKVNGGGMRLTINGNQGYNIVKKEWLWKDGSTLLEDNFKVKQHSNSVWFVSERERIRYSHEDKTFRDVEAKMEVTRVEFDMEEPEEETFKLEFPPGTRVRVPGGEIVVGEDAEQELRDVMESGEKLMGLGKALFIYANEDEKGRFPDTLKQLREGDYVSREDLEWLLEHVEYGGKGKTAADAPDSPIAFDKTLLQKSKGTNVLYLDGHIAFRAADEKEVDRKTSREHKRIEGLIDQFHRTKAILAYAEHMQSLPNLEQKVAEYKRKLVQISKAPPYDPDETLPEELEKSKQIYGDDWKHIHSELRSTVGTLILSELLDDTEFEPFVRFMTMYSNAITIIPIEHRDDFALSSGINPYHEPDAFWKAYKEHLKQVCVDFGAKSRLTKLKEQFDVPNEIIDTIRTEMVKGWQMYGYRFFIGVLSPSDKGLQQTQKHLDSIEQELNKYPNWEKIEQEMFQGALFPAKGPRTDRELPASVGDATPAR